MARSQLGSSEGNLIKEWFAKAQTVFRDSYKGQSSATWLPTLGGVYLSKV